MRRSRWAPGLAVLVLAGVAFGTGPCSGELDKIDEAFLAGLYASGKKPKPIAKLHYTSSALTTAGFFADTDGSFSSFGTGNGSMSGTWKKSGTSFKATGPDADALRKFVKQQFETASAVDGYTVQIDTAKLTGTAVKTKNPQVYKVAGSITFTGVILSGPHTGSTIKGKLTMKSATNFIG